MEHAQPRAQLLTPKQAAKHYGFGVSTLAKMRLQGGGPAYYKIGAKVLYDGDEIDAWLLSKRVTNTSQCEQRLAADRS